MNKLTIFCDGGARGNPGPSACAYVVYGAAEKLQYKCGKYLGTATNNEAEYHAVIEALAWLNTQKLPSLTEVSFFLDSLLVVNQINGSFKVKEPRLRQLMLAVQGGITTLISAGEVSACTFSHVLREKNKEADLLVNETLDSNS